MNWMRYLTGAALTLSVVILPGPWGGQRIPPQGVPTSSVAGEAARGARLFRQLDCVRCHTEPRSEKTLHFLPSLEFAGDRAPAAWMASWLRDPVPLRFASEGLRPRIRMPAAPVSPTEARHLAAYLSTVRDSTLFGNVPPQAGLDDSALVSLGGTLFRQYQCLGCHRLGGEGRQIGPALDQVGLRRRPRYVMALLQEPDAVIPGTAMRDFDLWPEEIRALTAFLMSLGADEAP